MLDPVKLAELDQCEATLCELLPPFWFSMFRSLQTAGFTPEQAMELLKTYIEVSLARR